jgi:hypothetical protein
VCVCRCLDFKSNLTLLAVRQYMAKDALINAMNARRQSSFASLLGCGKFINIQYPEL